MERRVRSVPLGNGSTRHHVTILDEPSSRGDRVRQHAFIAEVVNNGPFNGMWHCGPIPWQKMTAQHDGTRWTIQMEAIEGEPAVITRRG